MLLTDDPAAERLSDLPRRRRLEFLESMERLGGAVERACAGVDPQFRRVNVEILGNTDPYLHAHVWPRYGWEPPELLGKPVWLYPARFWSDQDHALGSDHEELRAAITRELAADD